jgi:hypothetical protein
MHTNSPLIIHYYASDFKTVNGIVAIGQVSAYHHGLFMMLLSKVTNTFEPINKVYIAEIAKMLPDLLTGEKGIDLTRINDADLYRLFVGSESLLMELHKPQHIDQIERDSEAAPFPVTSEPMADMLANLTAATESVSDAQWLIKNCSVNFLNAFSCIFSEIHRDPQERMDEYRLNAYKTQFPENSMIALGM